MRVWLAVALTWSCSACAFGDGEPYGQVTGALTGGYELRDDRDVGEDDWQKLVSELEIVVDDARLTVEVVELVGASEDIAAVTGAVFDPANPPPGFTLCHNGHCHSDSGDLVDYADIEAQLAGGGSTGATTALAMAGGEHDLLAGATLPLSCDDCLLDAGRVSRVRLTASRLELAGRIRDGLGTPRFDGSHSFEASVGLLSLAGDPDVPGALEQSVSLPLGDEHASAIALQLRLDVSAALFDGLDPVAIAAAIADGPLRLHDDSSVRSAFAELPLSVHIDRNDP
jgi:hypothetical protein